MQQPFSYIPALHLESSLHNFLYCLWHLTGEMTGYNEDHKVSFKSPRSFATVFKSGFKETLFPDDPFHFFKKEPSSSRRAKLALNYFVPASEWLPKYNLQLFKYDVLAGITVASLAIPQGISYAKLANIPPIIGLCKLCVAV